ncbi:MAG: DNA polymerase, partial [Clostridiaceae bacterium]
VRNGDFDAVKMLYEDVPDTLSQLIRTAFVPRVGAKLIVADFSAIEARVIAWLAGEQWRQEVFAAGKDIYCMSASQMFNVPVEKHGINSHLRQKGKIAELACIAEGQMVLTDRGLVPIEAVTTDMHLWDGDNWVRHDGVIFKGEREVITYEGLTATKEHLVWIEGQSEPVQLGIASARGAHLMQTGNGRNPVGLGGNHQPGKAMEQRMESLLCSHDVHGLWFYSMAKPVEPKAWQIKRLPRMLTKTANTEMARQTLDCCKATLRKPQRCGLRKLWRERDSFRFSKRNCSGTVPDRKTWITCKRTGDRQNRQRKGLLPRESALYYAHREQFEQTLHGPLPLVPRILAVCSRSGDKEALRRPYPGRYHTGCRNCSVRKAEELEGHQRTARLYDIRNAGTHHRFTVSDKLVHNCGYGGSVGALKAMGALDMGLTEEELPPLVDAWRHSNPKIVKFWWDVDRAAMDAVRNKHTNMTHGITFSCQSGMLFITLPSGRKLAYVKPRIGENKFGGKCITYEGVGGTKKWERLDSYGPKFVENIVQATARDILCYAMQTMREYAIVMHVHDEVVIEADPDISLQAVCDQMGRTPPWAKGLLLRADGYETDFYRKD